MEAFIAAIIAAVVRSIVAELFNQATAPKPVIVAEADPTIDKQVADSISDWDKQHP